MIEKLNLMNLDINIKDLTDSSFAKYGKVIPSQRFEKALEYIGTLDIPTEGNNYVANDSKLETIEIHNEVYNDLFGYMPIQYGFVNGQNSLLNALEYHKSTEINIAHSPMVLFLGLASDIDNNEYNSELLEAFYIPAGTVVELFPRTLHFAPCKVVNEGFRCGVILPRDTNVDFVSPSKKNTEEDQLLFKTNKWILAHVENKALIEKGAHPGLRGTNYKIKF